MEPAPQSPLMTIAEVMSALKVSRGTVRNLVLDKKLRVVRPRPHVPRILREDVLKLAAPPTESGFEAMQEPAPAPEARPTAFEAMQRAQQGRTR
jgi:excisionase family DNA binding protein